MSLSTISITQALDIWEDLEDARNGVNGFGSDTAEIYVFRVMPWHPGIDPHHPRYDEEYDVANVALFELFTLYEQRRNVRLHVYGKKLGPWLKKAREKHRLHVRVEQNARAAG